MGEDYEENENTKEKTKRDVKLLETFLRNEKSVEREVQNIEAAKLNKHLSDFIRSVRRKDREDYEPSSFRCLVSSIETFEIIFSHSLLALMSSFWHKFKLML